MPARFRSLAGRPSAYASLAVPEYTREVYWFHACIRVLPPPARPRAGYLCQATDPVGGEWRGASKASGVPRRAQITCCLRQVVLGAT